MSLLEKIFGKRKAPDALAEVPRAWDEASERLWRIHGKLERLRKADVRLMTFGSSHHRYRTTPVPLEEIERFEQENGIELPSELREILHYIGCGAGPYYGLYTLEAMRRVFDEWSSLPVLLPRWLAQASCRMRRSGISLSAARPILKGIIPSA